jgi:hypothetical protein
MKLEAGLESTGHERRATNCHDNEEEHEAVGMLCQFQRNAGL